MSLMKRLEGQIPSSSNNHNDSTNNPKDIFGVNRKDTYNKLREMIQERLIQEFNQEKLENEELQSKVTEILKEITQEEDISVNNREIQRLVNEILDEIIGLGPITKFVKDPSITEIMVNGANQIYVEKEGKLEETNEVFRDDAHVLYIIEKIVTPIGRRIDESSPMVDARLPNGSRVNAIIPPLALDGPILTIRKFSDDP